MADTRWIDHLARLRRLVVAHPIVRWSLAGVLAVGAGAAVESQRRAAAAERSRWATSIPVAVVVDEVPAGAALTPENVELRPMPVAAVPPSALVGLPVGAVALHPLALGEIVVAGHTTIGDGRAALLPLGTSGVAVPAPVGWSPLAGDPVSVFGIGDPIGIAGAPPAATGLLTASATVISAGPDGILLAVGDADAAAVAEAGASGRAVLVLRRSPGP